MGKIKEAFMIQEEIKDEVKEKFNVEIDFDILDFCHTNQVKPHEVKEMVMTNVEAGEIEMRNKFGILIHVSQINEE